MSSLPEFSLTQPKYDQNTFSGRLRHFLSVTDFRNLFYSSQQILEAKDKLEKFKLNGKGNFTNEELWHAKGIVDANIHPATGDIIPSPFRMCAIAPVNIPIVYSMIAIPPQNIGAHLFWQWINQSYNTACNYYNRSGDSMEVSQIAKSYGLAVTTACALSYVGGKIIEKGPPVVKRLGILVPYVAVASAGISNVVLTRYQEIADGIPMKSPTGEDVGKSKKAGLSAVLQTAGSRAAMVPMAVLLLPPAIMKGFQRYPFFNNPRVNLFTQLVVITSCIGLAVPAAIAMFPQTASFDVKNLEPEFSNLKDANGNSIQYLYANKGL